MDQENNKNIIFGKATPQLIHDIRNPLNIITGFSSILQMDETITSEVRSYLTNILYSGFRIEELLSNIEYYMMNTLELPFEEIDMKKEFDIFIRQNNEILNEKEIMFRHNMKDPMKFVLPKEIFSKILYNLFQFSLKGLKSVSFKQIFCHFNVDEAGLTIYYTDTATPVFIEKDYFSYEEISKAKRGLFPLFLEKLIKEHHGTILYLVGKKWNDISEHVVEEKTQHGFFLTIPHHR